MFPVVFDRAFRASLGPEPGAVALMAWALRRYTDATNKGIYDPRPVRGGTTLSTHAEGRAVDVGFPVRRPAGHPEGWRLARDLVSRHRELGIQQIIWAGQLWRNTSQTWRPYTPLAGGSDHFDHVHAELTRDAGRRLTNEAITAAFNPRPPVPPARPPVPPSPTVEAHMTPYPANHAWSIVDLPHVAEIVDVLYEAHVGLRADEDGRRSWARDLAGKLAAGQSPVETLIYIDYALRGGR